MDFLLPLLLGAVLGAIACWLATRKLVATRTNAIEGELRAQLQQRETELVATRTSLAQSERQLAGNEAQARRVPELERALTESQTQLATLKERVGQAEAQVAAAAMQLSDQQKQHDRALAELESKFAELSVQALDKNSKAFLTLAKETLGKFQEGAKGDLSLKQKEIEKLLQPLQENLKQYQERLQQSETEQSKTLGELRQRLVTLDAHSVRLEAETGNLVSALKAPQARGRWGEITLQRVVEVAGLSRYCDFETQVSTDTEEGRLRPDLVVRLPQNKTVIVDSKVPLKAYLDALESKDEPTRQAAALKHAQAVRKHMKDLSGKAYWNQFENTPEFVVLFLPGESFFSAALEQDRELIEDGLASHVLVATPTTLIALLRTVAASWQQHEQAENARKIAEAGADLFDRICKFIEHINKIRRGLETAVGAYNEATGSFERMLLPGARRLQELRVVPETKALPEIESLDATLRPAPDQPTGKQA